MILRTGIGGLLRRTRLVGRHRRRLIRGGPVLLLCRRLVLVRRLGRRALHRRNRRDHRGLRRRLLIRWRGLILLMDSRPRLMLLVLHRRLVGRLIRLLSRWLVRRTHLSRGLLRGRDRRLLIGLLGHGRCLHRPLGRGHGRSLR